jgi:hypothetical protein
MKAKSRKTRERESKIKKLPKPQFGKLNIAQANNANINPSRQDQLILGCPEYLGQ